MRLALSQVKALSWLRPGSGIPSISTAYAQARRRCAQVIHMFVHRQQGSSPVAWLAGSSGSARRCLRARPAGRMRGSGPGLDEIAPEGSHRTIGVAHSCWRALRWSCAGLVVGTAPSVPTGSAFTASVAAQPLKDLARAPGCHPTRLAFGRLPACRSGKDASAKQSQVRPSMYEMEGLTWLYRARTASCLASLAPPASAGHPCEGPVSQLLPRSRGRPQGGARFQRRKHFYCLRERAGPCGQ